MGTWLAGDFVLEELLGRGGMGSVHGALQASTGRRVAVKLLASDALDAERVARFEREAAALSRLSHPNIVHIYTHGRDPEGRPFLAMELVDGRTLQALLAAEGRLDVGRAVTLATQIVEGLAYAHERQIAHRDVKPSNVMVARVLGRELVKLVDFGLAKLLDDSVEAGTQSGRLLGSAPYMSPEQWNQRRDIDGRADLYSFGCVLYELLTGRPPFEASGMVGYLKAHLAGAFPDPVALRPELAQHPELVAILAQVLATDRDARPADALALLAALRPLELRYRAALAPLPPIAAAPAGGTGTAPTRSSDGAIGTGWVSSVMTAPARSVSAQRGRRRRLGAAVGAAIAGAAVVVAVALAAGGGSTTEVLPAPAAASSAATAPQRPEPVATASSEVLSPRVPAPPPPEDAPREVAPAPPAPEDAPREVAPAPDDAPPAVAPAPDDAPAAALVVHVESSPSGAEVVYDGAARGTTPLDLTLRDGAPARLIVRRAGFEPRTVALDLARAGEGPIVVELVRTRRHGAPVGATPEPSPAELPLLNLDRLPIE